MGGGWKGSILLPLRLGPKRFGERERSVVDVSETVLIRLSRELAAAEVRVRHDYRQVGRPSRPGQANSPTHPAKPFGP